MIFIKYFFVKKRNHSNVKPQTNLEYIYIQKILKIFVNMKWDDFSSVQLKIYFFYIFIFKLFRRLKIYFPY